jgi:tetratricopeptide (TPR) repeat protein
MKKMSMVAVLFCFLFVVGCAATHKYHEEGSKFSYDDTFQIVLNTTNKRDIIQKYGQPTSQSTIGKYQVLTYQHRQQSFKRKGMNPLSFVPVVGLAVSAVEISSDKDHTNDTIHEWEKMVVYTDLMTGIVKDFYYHDSKLQGHDESESIYIKAHQLLGKGNTDEAVKLLKESVVLNPNNHRALNALAWQLIDLGIDIDKGVQYARQAVTVFPDSPHNNGTLGVGYLKNGDPDNAIKYLQAAIDLFPIYAPRDHKALQFDKAMLEEARRRQKG